MTQTQHSHAELSGADEACAKDIDGTVIEIHPMEYPGDEAGMLLLIRKGEQHWGNLSAFGWETDWPWISALHVPERFRRKRAATALVLAVIEKAREAGKRSLHLWVKRDNEPAIELYRSLGFMEVLYEKGNVNLIMAHSLADTDPRNAV